MMKSESTFQFIFSDLKLDVAQIERTMGYKNGESNEHISDLINEKLLELSEKCTVRAEYRIFEQIKFNGIEKTVEILDQILKIEKIVFSQLKKADSIAVFLCTAGKEPGYLSRKAMKEGDLLSGYVYDVIGSEIVETAADIMQESLGAKAASSGLKITNRYSPGYCGWNVAEQHKLFQLMRNNYCAITLNSSALMDPEKSVSGFIGIGSEVRYNQYTCRLCDMKDCIYRSRRS
jgi:hypothetical protein